MKNALKKTFAVIVLFTFGYVSIFKDGLKDSWYEMKMMFHIKSDSTGL